MYNKFQILLNFSKLLKVSNNCGLYACEEKVSINWENI